MHRIAVILIAGWGVIAQEEDDLLFIERTFAVVPARLSICSKPVVGKNAALTAFTVTDGERYAVMINGMRGKWFDSVMALSVSPNGTAVFYVAPEGKRAYLVRNHLPFGGDCEQIERYAASDDSWAFIGKTGKQRFFVDKNGAKPVQKIEDLWFDGKHALCLAYDEKGAHRIYIDGVESAELAQIDSGSRPHIFLNSRAQPVAVCEGSTDDFGSLILKGGKQLFQGVRSVRSTDGVVSFYARKGNDIVKFEISLETLGVKESKFAALSIGVADWNVDSDGVLTYVDLEDGKQRLVIRCDQFQTRDDGLDAVDFQSFKFNLKSRTYAYTAFDGSDLCLIINNKKLGHWDGIVNVTISDAGTVACVANRGSDFFVLTDGVPGTAYDEIRDLGIAPDGKTVYHVGIKDGKAFTIIGRSPTTTTGFDESKIPVFSSDCKLWIHRALDGEDWVVASDHGEKRFRDVQIPVMSPDGSVTAYVASKDSGPCLVINDKIADEFSSVFSGPHISPDSSAVAVGVIKGRKLLWKVYETK